MADIGDTFGTIKVKQEITEFNKDSTEFPLIQIFLPSEETVAEPNALNEVPNTHEQPERENTVNNVQTTSNEKLVSIDPSQTKYFPRLRSHPLKMKQKHLINETKKDSLKPTSKTKPTSEPRNLPTSRTSTSTSKPTATPASTPSRTANGLEDIIMTEFSASSDTLTRPYKRFQGGVFENNTKEFMQQSPRRWFQRLENVFYANYGLQAATFFCWENADRIFHCSEIRFKMTPSQKNGDFPPRTPCVHLVGRNKKEVSAFCCVSANGRSWKPVISLPGESAQIEALKDNLQGIHVTALSNGRVSAHTFADWVENVFYADLKECVEFPVVLLIDYNSFPIYTMIDFFLKKKIFLFAFPPQTFYNSQPLRLTAFKTIERGWRKSVETWRRNHHNASLKLKGFLEVFLSAWEDATKPDDLSLGFQDAGLIPFRGHEQLNYPSFSLFKRVNGRHGLSRPPVDNVNTRTTIEQNDLTSFTGFVDANPYSPVCKKKNYEETVSPSRENPKHKKNVLYKESGNKGNTFVVPKKKIRRSRIIPASSASPNLLVTSPQEKSEFEDDKVGPLTFRGFRKTSSSSPSPKKVKSEVPTFRSYEVTDNAPVTTRSLHCQETNPLSFAGFKELNTASPLVRVNRINKTKGIAKAPVTSIQMGEDSENSTFSNFSELNFTSTSANGGANCNSSSGDADTPSLPSQEGHSVAEACFKICLHIVQENLTDDERKDFHEQYNCHLENKNNLTDSVLWRIYRDIRSSLDKFLAQKRTRDDSISEELSRSGNTSWSLSPSEDLQRSLDQFLMIQNRTTDDSISELCRSGNTSRSLSPPEELERSSPDSGIFPFTGFEQATHTSSDQSQENDLVVTPDILITDDNEEADFVGFENTSYKKCQPVMKPGRARASKSSNKKKTFSKSTDVAFPSPEGSSSISRSLCAVVVLEKLDLKTEDSRECPRKHVKRKAVNLPPSGAKSKRRRSSRTINSPTVNSTPDKDSQRPTPPQEGDLSVSFSTPDTRETVDRSEDGTYHCDECRFSTIQKEMLKKHQQLHIGQVLLKCSKCKFNTFHQSALKNHETTHTRVIACSQCNFTTNSAVLLNRHIWNMHNGKSYSCSYCNFSTYKDSYLRMHLKNKCESNNTTKKALKVNSEPQNQKVKVNSEPQNQKGKVNSEPQNQKSEVNSELQNQKIKVNSKPQNQKLKINPELQNKKSVVANPELQSKKSLKISPEHQNGNSVIPNSELRNEETNSELSNQKPLNANSRLRNHILSKCFTCSKCQFTTNTTSQLKEHLVSCYMNVSR